MRPKRIPSLAEQETMPAGVAKPKPLAYHERAIAEDSPIRKYTVIVSSGSKQRELLKVVARKSQGKK